MKKTFTRLTSLAITIILSLVMIVNAIPFAASAASESTFPSDGNIIGTHLRTYKLTFCYKTAEADTTDLAIYADVRAKILEEKAGKFKIECDNNNYYWIKTSECLINISEYIPSLVITLDMAKSTNYFSMGGEEIPSLTNRQFYKNPGSISGEECWLKYSSAKKLLKAQQSFLKDGYTICIFDAYRPFSTSMQFKDAYSNYLAGKSTTFKNKYFGELGESWFLAQKASSHNYGNAIDMSLINQKTGKLLSMPSRIHTLDCSSAFYTWKNSTTTEATNAKYLKKTMEQNGFSSLKSEWWHFQDDSTTGDVIDVPN